MDVGVSGGVIRFPGDPRPLVELYQSCVRYAGMAEQNGFDFIWVGEHHFAPNQWNPSSLPILGAFASATSKIRLGTNVIVVPYHNPLRLAEDVATVDLLSNGRMDFVVGSGSVKDEFETFGIEPKERWGRMFETMEIIRRSFAEEQFDHRGRYFHFPNIRMTTKPVQEPFPMWIAGSGPKTVARAGREGYHLQVPGLMDLGPLLESFENGVREGGRRPEDFNYHVMANVVVEETWNEQKAAVLAARMKGFRAFYESRPLVYDNAILDRHPAFSPVAGTPEQVLKTLEPTLKNSKITHIQVGIPDPRGFEFFAKEMLPTLRQWGRAPVTAAPARTAAH